MQVNAVLSALALWTASTSASAPAATPPLIWRDVKTIGVHCIVQSDERGHDAEFSASLCERIRGLAARSAPAPVKVIPMGDPALLAADTVVLLVHGSIQSDSGSNLLTFSLRPFRASSDQTNILFGTPPRAVRLSPPAGIDQALEGALADILPWQQRPDGPRPISNRP